jgi:hypothetical protein
MFKKILIANRGARAAGAVVPAKNGLKCGAAARAGEFTAGAHHV